MDIDKLFKVPKLPSSGNKRKLPDNPTPELLKKLKVENTSPSQIASPSSSTDIRVTNSKKASVEDVQDADEDVSFAPGGDADYFAEEDDEGRFFGGGLTLEQKEILNIFEKAEGGSMDNTAEDLSITKIRKWLLSFERAVNKNQDQRSKYPDDPTKFIDSEADLDSAIKALLPLSQSPSLAYPELVRSGTVALLTGLLTHENMDIVIDVIELIYELTEEDAEVDYEDEDYEDSQGAIGILVDGLVENQALDLLVDNLSRLNESDEADRQGVFHILGIFENIVGFNPALSAGLVLKTKVLSWLLSRVQSKTHDENRSYAAELLSIFLQDSVNNKLEFGRNNGVEVILKALSQYRRRDPIDADETEFMENLFDALCSALSESPVKQLFLDAEGPDLMILMMKDKMESKSRSIKVLDYAMSGGAGTAICEAFIDALGLKTLFTAFMGKASKRQKGHIDLPATGDVGHILGIVSSLLTNLQPESTSRIRVLAKFVEGDYEKIDKLLEIRDAARKRLTNTDAEIEEDKQNSLESTGEVAPEVEDSYYIRRLDGGLFTLQTVDYILAWLVMEDDGIRSHASRMLDRRGHSLKDIVQTLQQYHEHVGDDSPETEATVSQKEILLGLILALDSTS
ncbi:Catenin-beta-like protein [Gymnopilus junonius]|uniref:Catenin-beta-like protein n=1 Tax=Gymnopilus junonius TaxID=109634 RepID=A0A9P5P400_GYMJU|nr:Catenin-beta-like protein [Gymnopilus junonius]